jgi:YegS/Rv2252/BmrU family lipid kinase
MKKLLFIYNPHAGKGKIVSQLHEVTDIFQRSGYLVTLYATVSPRDGVQVTHDLAEQYDHIICAGGDGTLSEVITGLMTTNYAGALGYLPMGSTNDFARTLGLPSSIAEMAETAVSGVPVPCDIGGFNERTFVYVAAFGVFTAVSYETPQEFKNIFGHMAYVLEGIRSLADITPYHLRIAWDEGCVEDDFIYGAVSNSISVGGFRGMLSDHVVLDDGLFEVLLVRNPTSLPMLNNIITALLKNTPDENVIAFQASSLIMISASEIPWTLDGENGGKHCFVQVRNHNSAVRMMCSQPEQEETT